VISYVNKGTLSLLDDDDDQSRGRKRLPTISIRQRTLEKILSYAPHPLAEITDLVGAGKPLPRFELENPVQIKWGFAPADTVQAWNVMGILPGNDPALRDQHVVIGAHYDHVGVGLAGIYHGADDNASGTVGVLEVAKAFGYNRNNARPVVFAFHTAEEKGLLGSKFLVKNYPGRENIMVHINLDMIGRGAVDSIYSVGSDRISPELKQIVEEVNRNTININFNYRFDDPNDPERIYYRSDHYSYAREGIPTVFFYDNMQEDYHKTTDTADKINLVKVANMVELVYQTSVRLANLPQNLSRNREAEK
jgi:Zn-dependent M28 family amino/carboxypeptidase